MISPEIFVEQHVDDSYAELISVRDELIDDINEFEATPNNKEQSFVIHPNPEVVYQMNLEYLSKICLLVEKKFRDECKLTDL